MANFYLDISAIGNEYQAYNDVPTTFGMPQDGNGKAGPGHSAAVAVATLDCTSAVGDGSQTLSILGITVSNASAASGATLAASLVASINTTATATTATYCAALLPLNKLIFARQNPGNANQVQVMLRIAGTDWNGIAPAHAGFTTGPAITAFSGGADGPFAYFVNESAIFGKAAFAAGMWSLKSKAVTEPTLDDPIHVRTRRAGVDLQNSAIAAATFSVLCTGLGRSFLFDDGTVWAGDNGQFVLTTRSTDWGTYVMFATYIGGHAALSARQQYGLKVRIGGNVSASTFGVDGNGGFASIYLHNVLIEQYNAIGGSQMVVGCRAATSNTAVIDSCKIVYSSDQRVMANISSAYNLFATFRNTTIEWAGIGGNVTGVINTGGDAFGNNGAGVISFVGCNFVVDGGAFTVGSFFTGGSYITSACLGLITVENCRGLRNPSIGMSANKSFPQKPLFYWRDYVTGSFRIESNATMVEYISTDTYPTLTAVNPQNSPMGTRFSWENARLNKDWQYEVGSFSYFYRAVSASLPVFIELLVPSVEVPSKAQIFTMVSYVDTGGVARTESSGVGKVMHLLGSVPPLDAGVGLGAWSLNGIAGLDSRKVGLTTAHPVKQNSEINVKLYIGGPPTGTRTIYVDPVVSIA